MWNRGRGGEVWRVYFFENVCDTAMWALISLGNTFHAGRIEAMTIVNGSSESSTRTKSGPSKSFLLITV